MSMRSMSSPMPVTNDMTLDPPDTLCLILRFRVKDQTKNNAATAKMMRRRNSIGSSIGVGRATARSMLLPVARPLHGLDPPPVERLPRGLGQGGRELAVEGPVAHHVVGVLPVADGEAGEVGGAERGGLGDDRPPHGHAQQVGL